MAAFLWVAPVAYSDVPSGSISTNGPYLATYDFDLDGIPELVQRSRTNLVETLVFFPSNGPFGGGFQQLVTVAIETRWIDLPDSGVNGLSQLRFLGTNQATVIGTRFTDETPSAGSPPSAAAPNSSHSEIYGVKFPTAMGPRRGWIRFVVTSVFGSGGFGTVVKNYSLAELGFEAGDATGVQVGEPTRPWIRLVPAGESGFVELLNGRTGTSLELSGELLTGWRGLPAADEVVDGRQRWALSRLATLNSGAARALFFRISR